jgi:penicillin-binding protein 1A
LGSCAASPLELAAAYGTLARGGIAIEPWTIRHIDDLNSHVKALYTPTPHRVLPEEPITKLVDIMQDVVTSGTGTLARLPDRPVAGKTGTADQGRDLWFIGFTPDMVTAVWGGNRENKPISDKHATGGSVMARVWREYNLAYYKKTPTPAGHLIAMQSKEIPTARPAARTASSREEEDIDLSAFNRRAESGTALRARQGVTEYDWSR